MTEFQKKTPAKQKTSQSLSKEQELEQRLYAYKASQTVSLEEEEILETLSKAKEAFYEGAKMHTVSRMEFLFNQMRYIKKWWWLCQGMVLVVLWRFLYSAGSDIYTQRIMGVLSAVFAILLVPELWKNRSSQSMEIEGTAYFSLRQVYAARMLLFAMADVLMLSIFCGVVSITVQITVKELLFYFFLPFNVTCCICFRLLYSRWVNSEYLAIALSLLWSAVWGWMVLKEAVYSAVMVPVWWGILSASLVYLLFTVYQVFKKCENYWEVNPIWN
ncbi:MAG: hypothetical protein K2K56_00690 [Lachnospiraceae bacterium]|nr:hypothetical protein [Lachnospiraceae bacterium]